MRPSYTLRNNGIGVQQRDRWTRSRGACTLWRANRVFTYGMGCFRVLLCIIFPPLAVLDRGCGAIVITTLLTICGWIPGVIAAIIFNTREA